jgi:Fe-S oxidoreductase
LSQIDPGYKISVVGLEPPEIYALKHEYVDLLPERALEIARWNEQVWLLDEFLLRSDAFRDLRVAILGEPSELGEKRPRSIRFHPHCHQRAEGLAADGLPSGTNATVELLRSAGYEVELLDTGCCGMAGSFGYEAEHYDVSMKVGELNLFPKLRTSTTLAGTSPKSDMDKLHADRSSAVRCEAVVSTGAACRLQIRQGTGIQAEHSVQMITRALMRD